MQEMLHRPTNLRVRADTFGIRTTRVGDARTTAADDALAVPLLRAERGRGCFRCNACCDDCVALVELILCKNVHFIL